MKSAKKPCPWALEPASSGMQEALPDSLSPRRTAPGPGGFPGVGCLPEMRRDVLAMMLRGMREHGDVVRYKLGPWTVHLICHPDSIGHVFTQPDRYDKDTFASAKIRLMTGNGLLVSNGEQWMSQRRAIQPAFAPSRVDGYIGLIVDRTKAMLDRWSVACRSGQSIDVASEMMRLTYGIIEQALFSSETQAGIGEIEEAVTIAMGHVYGRIQNPLSMPAFLPTPANLRFRRAIRTLESRVDAIIAEHRQGARQHDLLHDFIQGATASECSHWDDRSLRSQVVTLLLAGHETTANSLTWLWYLLDQHPEVADRLHQESRQLPDHGPLNQVDLKALDYTSMTLRETMRLYTPIWAILRRVIQADTVRGFSIPAGTLLIISPFVTHRHPEFWTDSERFDPLRFDSDKLRSMHPYAYIPFGGGPRFCVGKNLARLEGLIIAAMVSQRFRLRLVPGQRAMMDPGITLRCRDGLKMTVEARRDAKWG